MPKIAASAAESASTDTRFSQLGTTHEEATRIVQGVIKDGDILLFSVASGSLVEGLGNSLSDIDVYAIVQGPARKQSQFKQYFVPGRKRRFEITTIHIEDITRIFEQLHQKYVAEKGEGTSFYEVVALRLHIGLPITGAAEFREFLCRFDRSALQSFSSATAAARATNAYEDVIGCLDDKDTDTCLFNCRKMLDARMSCFLLILGQPDSLIKWRLRRVRNLFGERSSIYNEYFRLMMSVDATSEQTKLRHIVDSLRLHQLLVDGVEYVRLMSGAVPDIDEWIVKAGSPAPNQLRKSPYSFLHEKNSRFYLIHKKPVFELKSDMAFAWISINEGFDLDSLHDYLTRNGRPSMRTFIEALATRGIVSAGADHLTV